MKSAMNVGGNERATLAKKAAISLAGTFSLLLAAGAAQATLITQDFFVEIEKVSVVDQRSGATLSGSQLNQALQSVYTLYPELSVGTIHHGKATYHQELVPTSGKYVMPYIYNTDVDVADPNYSLYDWNISFAGATNLFAWQQWNPRLHFSDGDLEGISAMYDSGVGKSTRQGTHGFETFMIDENLTQTAYVSCLTIWDYLLSDDGSTILQDNIYEFKFCGSQHFPTPVPEPATVLCLGAGLLGLAGSRPRKKK